MQPILKNFNTKKLASIYLISTDELLLAQDARSTIKIEAEKQGFSDTEVMHMDSSFQWNHFLEKIQCGELFSQKRIIDLRNPSAKFDAESLDALKKLIDLKLDDILLLITTQKITAQQQKSPWFQLIIKHGVHFPLWPMSLAELPRWIQSRARGKNLQIEPEAALFLAQLSEGNLSAVDQAIEKCTLIYANEAITREKMAAVLEDHAQFTVFDLSDALLAQNAKRAHRILSTLKELGVEPTLILWAIAREIRELLHMQHQLQQGDAMQNVLSRVFSSKKTMTQKALARLSNDTLKSALQIAAESDEIIKGAMLGDAWQCFSNIILMVCKTDE